MNEIIDWLADNRPTVRSLIHYISEEAKLQLVDEPFFRDEIIAQYKNRIKLIVAEEISRQLGLSVGMIFEVLENPQVQEYLIDDSLCSDVGPA